MIDRPRGAPRPELLRQSERVTEEDICAPSRKLTLEDLLCRSGKAARKRSWIASGWGRGVLFLLALLLLFVYAQTLGIVSSALALPAPLRWLSWLGLALLVGLVGWALIRGLVLVAGLAGGAQLDLSQLRLPEASCGLQGYRIAQEEFLAPYLRRLRKLSGRKSKRYWELTGELKIADAVDRLLDEERRLGSREWVNEFQRTIQQPLIELAGKRITAAANAAALKTALSPWPLVDMIAVLYNSIRMLTDLALIFNRRLNRIGIVRILGELLLTLLVTGGTQEAVSAVEHFADTHNLTAADPQSSGAAAHSLIDTAFGSLGPGVLSAARFAAPRLAEGAAAWLLVQRLGHKAVSLFKPLVGEG